MADTQTVHHANGAGAGSASSSGVTDRAKEAVESAADDARERGMELQRRARDKAVTAADKRRGQVASRVRDVESSVQKVAGSVRSEQPDVADAIDSVAQRTERAAAYIESTPVEQMVQDVGRQAREHPVVVAAGMFTTGFLLARALKPVNDGSRAASGSSYGSRQASYGSQTPASAYMGR